MEMKRSTMLGTGLLAGVAAAGMMVSSVSAGDVLDKTHNPALEEDQKTEQRQTSKDVKSDKEMATTERDKSERKYGHDKRAANRENARSGMRADRQSSDRADVKSSDRGATWTDGRQNDQSFSDSQGTQSLEGEIVDLHHALISNGSQNKQSNEARLNRVDRKNSEMKRADQTKDESLLGSDRSESDWTADADKNASSIGDKVLALKTNDNQLYVLMPAEAASNSAIQRDRANTYGNAKSDRNEKSSDQLRANRTEKRTSTKQDRNTSEQRNEMKHNAESERDKTIANRNATELEAIALDKFELGQKVSIKGEVVEYGGIQGVIIHSRNETSANADDAATDLSQAKRD